MNNLKIVVVSFIIILTIIGFTLIFNTNPVEKLEENLPYFDEVEDLSVPFYSSNGGEK